MSYLIRINKPPGTCPYCGDPFISKGGGQVTCGKVNCQIKHGKVKRKEYIQRAKAKK